MHVATVPNRNSPPAILLRETYRDNGQVKHRTLKNISAWSAARIEALRRALKGEFDDLPSDSTAAPVAGPVFGVLFVLLTLAHRIGLVRALGHDRWAAFVLFLVLARVADQGSRLSAVRWAEDHAVAEVLCLGAFDEEQLYRALDWADKNQEKIEDRLYRAYVKQHGAPPALVLYDVTSVYLEGEDNELGDYGYERTGRKGKKQIVVGLLTGVDGEPLAVRVFRGNTNDPQTVAAQVETLKKRWKISDVVFVGDRGMVKAAGQEALSAAGFRHITALTDPQVRKLLQQGVLQLSLFDEVVAQVEQGGRRLVLKRNPAVAAKEGKRREDKLTKLAAKVAARNAFVAEHPRARPEVGLKNLSVWLSRHKLKSFVTLSLTERTLIVAVDEAGKVLDAELDGCYVLTTDVPQAVMDAATVDARYRGLQEVERDFRTLKTIGLEIRPLFVRTEEHTRGAIFVAMLALKLQRDLERRLRATFGTTDENGHAVTAKNALSALARLILLRDADAEVPLARLTQPDQRQATILKALDVSWPKRVAVDP